MWEHVRRGERVGAKPSALITFEGATVCGNGEVAEIEFSLYRADRYKFFAASKNMPQDEGAI